MVYFVPRVRAFRRADYAKLCIIRLMQSKLGKANKYKAHHSIYFA